MKHFREIIYSLVLIFAVGGPSLPAFAKKKPVVKEAKKTSLGVQKKKVRAKQPETTKEKYYAVRKAFRGGEINRKTFWEELLRIHERGSELPLNDRISLLQTQSTLLQDAGYPIVASIYAAQTLKISKNAEQSLVKPSWTLLRKVSTQMPIQNVLEIVADTVEIPSGKTPVFGSDWNYFEGNAASRRGDSEKAIKLYGEIKTSDRNFLAGRYQQAMAYLEADKLKEAEVALKSIVYPASLTMSPLSPETKRRIVDYTLLALGRIYYEQQDFNKAIKMYRQVSRDGANFYDALFEQSWAFFMGGYPMHALGALHSVESPFFAQVYNPEAPLMRSMVQYWLCRYEESRNGLADFLEQYAADVEKLDDFLDRKRIDPETSYQLFENLISGVSSEALGIPRSILQTAAERDSLLLVRDQYAAVVEERSRLEAKGVFGSKFRLDRPQDYLDRWSASLREDIGKRFVAELQDMKKDYERLHSQAQFLYVELLMSEKDQILGKELHASSKITKVSAKNDIAGWGGKTQAWKDGQIGEYWWDEIGFYIAPVEPLCNVNK
jgi:tetratricopeptide (TPR) repeat protein